MFDLELQERRQIQRCINLWIEVLRLGFRDALFKSKRNPEHLQETARQWIDSQDFEDVCGIIGLDVDYVRTKFRKLELEFKTKQRQRMGQVQRGDKTNKIKRFRGILRRDSGDRNPYRKKTTKEKSNV
jgi:hypothetical protein